MKLDPKFWTIIVDAVVSILGVVLTRFLSPDDLKMALTLVGILQPVVLAVIAALYGVEIQRMKIEAAKKQ